MFCYITKTCYKYNIFPHRIPAAMEPERGEKRKREDGLSDTVPMSQSERSQSDTDMIVDDHKESVKLEFPHPCDVGADQDLPIHVFLTQTLGEGNIRSCVTIPKCTTVQPTWWPPA